MGYTMLYCVLKGKTVKKVIKSIDFENWEITNEEVPQIVGNIMMKENDISARGYDFIGINYEETKKYTLFYTLGDWIVDKDEEGDFIFLMIIFIL